MRRIFDGGQPLYRTRIRETECSNVAIGPRLHSGPLDRVVAVAAFILVRRELTFGRVAPTNVLNHDGITASDSFVEGSPSGRSVIFPVWRAIDEHRKSALG